MSTVFFVHKRACRCDRPGVYVDQTFNPNKKCPKSSTALFYEVEFSKKKQNNNPCPTSVFQTTDIIDTTNEAVPSWARLFATYPTRLNCFRASRSVPMQRRHPAGRPAPRAARCLDPLVEVMLEFPQPSGCGPETFHELGFDE